MQEAILIFFQQNATPFRDMVANVCSAFGEENIVIAIILALFWCIDKKKGFLVSSSLLFALCTTGILKAIVRAPRPFQVMQGIDGKRLTTATGYSFPSGHTTTAAACYTSLAIVGRKRGLSIACAIAIVLVGISRIYLGVHWPLDVVGGLVVGISVGFIAIPRLSGIYDDKRRRIRLSLITGGTTALAALVMGLLLTFSLIDETAFGDLTKTLALSGTAFLGFAFECRTVDFSVSGSVGKRIVRYAVGMAGVLLIMASKSLFPPAWYYPGTLLRYGLLGFWITGLYPFIGKDRLF